MASVAAGRMGATDSTPNWRANLASQIGVPVMGRSNVSGNLNEGEIQNLVTKIDSFPFVLAV
jgi:hypothetical protein